VKHVSASRWPSPSELRVGLGCMRLSTDDDRGEERALATIAAAAAAGITVFDTARSYGHGAAELGHNERLLARALRACGSERAARIVTKGGMTRAGGGWVPDGRAKAIRVDCEASLASLDGLPIDLYLLHAPDPRVPWRTQVRALARLVDDGLVARVGVANVNRRQLDEALELAPLAAVQVAVSPFDDRALRGGVIDRCEEREACGSRALSARRAAPCGRDRPSRGARGGRPCARRERGRGRARLAPRPLPLAAPDPRGTTAGNGALRCTRRDARPRRG
jgi:predicted oxidoreductase